MTSETPKIISEGYTANQIYVTKGEHTTSSNTPLWKYFQMQELESRRRPKPLPHVKKNTFVPPRACFTIWSVGILFLALDKNLDVRAPDTIFPVWYMSAFFDFNSKTCYLDPLVCRKIAMFGLNRLRPLHFSPELSVYLSSKILSLLVQPC